MLPALAYFAVTALLVSVPAVLCATLRGARPDMRACADRSFHVAGGSL